MGEKDVPEVVKADRVVAKADLAEVPPQVVLPAEAVVDVPAAEAEEVATAPVVAAVETPEEAEVADEDHRFQTPSEPGHGPAGER